MAKKPITIDDLLYPIGHGSAISMRAIEKELTERFYKFVVSTVKLLACYKSGDNYYIHIKIPSENNLKSVSEVFYDVVFEFYPKNKGQEAFIYFREYGVKVFSNSPSFLFTFTHVFHEKEALPSFIPEKFYSKEAIKSPPKVRNRLELLGIEKTIWYAIHYIDRNHLFQKARFDQIALKKGSYKDIIKNIISQDEKLHERKTQKPKPKEKKKSGSSSGGEIEKPKSSPEKLAEIKKPSSVLQSTSMKANLSSSHKTSMKTTALKSSTKTNPFKKK